MYIYTRMDTLRSFDLITKPKPITFLPDSIYLYGTLENDGNIKFSFMKNDDKNMGAWCEDSRKVLVSNESINRLCVHCSNAMLCAVSERHLNFESEEGIQVCAGLSAHSFFEDNQKECTKVPYWLCNRYGKYLDMPQEGWDLSIDGILRNIRKCKIGPEYTLYVKELEHKLKWLKEQGVE